MHSQIPGILYGMISDIANTRLHTQQLVTPMFSRPEDVVKWFGAVQSQDFAAAKWALALRTKSNTDADIEKAFNEGKILRTHVMRPTWHFVTPEDIPWLLALTAEKVKKFNGSYFRRSGYDHSIFTKSNRVIEKALTGGEQLTRNELKLILEKEGIPLDTLGLSFVLMQAELDGIAISGPRKGKQFTYMLFAERVPKIKALSHDEALAALIERYIQSHGPAQIQDFVWWSGLTVADAKKGIELLGSAVHKEERSGKTYWFFNHMQSATTSPSVLVPGFDEYFIAYKDRSDILDKQYAKQLNLGGGMVSGAIVIKGRMVGGWRRAFEKKHVVITLRLFEEITASEQKALEGQVQKYSTFIGLPAVIQQSG